MAKDWIKISTVNDVKKVDKNDQRKKEQGFSNLIRNTKTKDYKELQKEGKDAFSKRASNNENILSGYENKKLKSKRLIKKAQSLKKKDK